MRTIYSVIFLSFLIIILLVTTVISSSDDWVEIDTYKGDIYLYNKVGVTQRTRDIVQVWTKDVYSDEGREEYIQRMRNKKMSTERYDRLSHTISLLEIDCKKNRFQILSITEYDTDGNVSSSYSYDNPSWSYITPDSQYDILRKEVCK